ncbi:MAG: hypothetical protein U0K23_01185 [Selenomonadaceae bacterium]|nr:hypothetical protein [Selenomonadaceae bacterium]
MNGIINPKFEHEHILRTTMLNAINDMAHDYPVYSYDGYGNGIIKGCNLVADGDRLKLEKGIILYAGEICYIREPIYIDYEAAEVFHSIKLRFSESVFKAGCSCRNVTLSNSSDMELMDNEMELCRFKLKAGSRLRSQYRSFNDFATEYDTVNIVNVKYASPNGKTTLHPSILRYFAKEALHRHLQPLDQMFVLSILRDNEPVSKEFITAYLSMRLGVKNKEYNNEELFEMLGNALGEIQDGEAKNVDFAENSRSNRGMLLD